MGSKWGFAPIVTRLTFTTNNESKQVANGEPVHVFGWIITSDSSTAGNGVVLEPNSPTVLNQDFYHRASLDQKTTRFSSVNFIADRGLRIRVGGNVTGLFVTVFHSHPGV